MISRLMLLLFLVPGVSFASHWCALKPSKAEDPGYPPIAKAARVQGVVISRLEFDATGSVSKVEIVSGPALLAKAVESSEARWIFMGMRAPPDA